VGDGLLSLIRTCVVNAVDPVDYLTAIATNAEKARVSPEPWLPWNYQKRLEKLN
jgi:hypothetical protein